MTQPAQPAKPTQPAQPVKRGGRSGGLLITGLALLVVALLLTVVAAAGMAWGARDFIGAFGSPAIAVPGQGAAQLSAGRWSVMQRADGRAAEIDARDIEVVGPTGSVPVADVTATETLERNGVVYQAVARFDAPADGVYGIRVAESEPSEIIMAPSLIPVFIGAMLWLVLLGVAIVAGLAGVALVIVALSRRAQSAQPTGA